MKCRANHQRSFSKPFEKASCRSILPRFNGFPQASKIVGLIDDNDNNGEISPGDKIMYTIVVKNPNFNPNRAPIITPKLGIYTEYFVTREIDSC
jgi:hypothetical protein